MNKEQKEFIIEAHKESCRHWKMRIEEQFSELIKDEDKVRVIEMTIP